MDDAKRQDIKQIIKKLLFETGLDDGKFPFPVEKLANMLGYDSFYFAPTDKTRHISGAIEHDKHRILINQTDPLARQLFTAAHEIGHLILHKERGNKIDFRTTSIKATDPIEIEIETEANVFAAELLIPEEEFKKKWKEHNGDLSLICAYFGVSYAAAQLRSEHLQLKKKSIFNFGFS